MCGGDAALCQITLTTCSISYGHIVMHSQAHFNLYDWGLELFIELYYNL